MKQRPFGRPPQAFTRRWAAPGVAVLTLALACCAGLPSPRGEDDALVIGSVVLEFPDGFTGGWSRSIRSNVFLHFVDTTTNRRLCRLTTDGYYSFLAKGTDQYVLDRFEYSLLGDEAEYEIRDKLELPISVSPGAVAYQGHLTVSYARPKTTNKPSVVHVTEREGFEAPPGGNARTFPVPMFRMQTDWSYERSLDLRRDEDKLIAYLRRKDPRSPWLSREIAK
jgi:hypothetical protein